MKLLSLFALAFLLMGIASAININSCQALSTNSATYTLTANVTGSGDNCFNITGNDITLICGSYPNYHTITAAAGHDAIHATGNDPYIACGGSGSDAIIATASGSRGIYIEGSTTGSPNGARIFADKDALVINNSNFAGNGFYSSDISCSGYSGNCISIINSTVFFQELTLKANNTGINFTSGSNYTYIFDSSIDANTGIYLDNSTVGNEILANRITSMNSTGYFAIDYGTNNRWNGSIGASANEGNLWGNVLTHEALVIGNAPANPDKYAPLIGFAGPGFPYDATTSLGRVLGNVHDYLPLTKDTICNCTGATKTLDIANSECFLTADQYATTGNDCIDVLADNITVDCNGYTIYGNNDNSTFGILSVNATNTKIRNCNVQSFESDIGIFGDTVNSIQTTGAEIKDTHTFTDKTLDTNATFPTSGILTTWTANTLISNVSAYVSSPYVSWGIIAVGADTNLTIENSSATCVGDFNRGVSIFFADGTKIINTNASSPGTNGGGFVIFASPNSLLDNVNGSGQDNGISIRQTSHNTVLNNSYAHGNNIGVVITAGGNNITVENTQILVDNGVSLHPWGIWSGFQTNLLISNVSINASESGMGAYLGDFENGTMITGCNFSSDVGMDMQAETNVTIENTASYSANDNAIRFEPYDDGIDPPTYGGNNSIINSNGTAGGGMGIYLATETDDQVINSTGTAMVQAIVFSLGANNTIMGSNGTAGGVGGIFLLNEIGDQMIDTVGYTGTNYGIYLSSGFNNTIIGSNGTANGNYGIWFDQEAGDLLANSTGTAAVSYGIDVGDSSNSFSGLNENNSVINSTGTAGYQYGIALEYGDNNSIADSSGISNFSTGIHILSSSDSQITASNGTATNDNGIFLESSSYSNISNCVGNSSGGGGIDLYLGSSNNQITNSTGATDGTYGILLQSDSDNNLIANSTAYAGTSEALSLWTANYNQFINNTLISDGTELYAHAGGGSNTLYWNNFTDPTGLYVEDDSGLNFYNTTGANGEGEGNIWGTGAQATVAAGITSNHPAISSYGTGWLIGNLGGDGNTGTYDDAVSGGMTTGVTDNAPLLPLPSCDCNNGTFSITTPNYICNLTTSQTAPSGQNCFDVTAENATIECNGNTIAWSGTFTQTTAINGTSANNLHINDCTITGYWLAAVYLLNTTGASITGSLLNGQTSTAYLEGGSHNSIIASVSVANINGLWLINETNDTIANSTLYYNQTYTDTELRLINTTGSVFSNNTFTETYGGSVPETIIDAHSIGNLFFWNRFANQTSPFVDDASASNHYNTTTGGHGEGNIWGNIKDLNISSNPSTASLYGSNYFIGNNGTGYPYNDTNSQGMTTGVRDYAPLLFTPPATFCNITFNNMPSTGSVIYVPSDPFNFTTNISYYINDAFNNTECDFYLLDLTPIDEEQNLALGTTTDGFNYNGSVQNLNINGNMTYLVQCNIRTAGCINQTEARQYIFEINQSTGGDDMMIGTIIGLALCAFIFAYLYQNSKSWIWAQMWFIAAILIAMGDMMAINVFANEQSNTVLADIGLAFFLLLFAVFMIAILRLIWTLYKQYIDEFMGTLNGRKTRKGE